MAKTKISELEKTIGADRKDIIAYLRLVQNPLDEASLLRVVNVPQRGIGTRTVGEWLAQQFFRTFRWHA